MWCYIEQPLAPRLHKGHGQITCTTLDLIRCRILYLPHPNPPSHGPHVVPYVLPYIYRQSCDHKEPRKSVTAHPLVPWSINPLVALSVGPLVLPLDPRSVPWSHGPRVPPFPGRLIVMSFLIFTSHYVIIINNISNCTSLGA